MERKHCNEMLERLFQKEYKNGTTVTLKQIWEEVYEKRIPFEEFSKLYDEAKRITQTALLNNYDSPKLIEWLKTTGLPAPARDAIAAVVEKHRGDHIVPSRGFRNVVGKYDGMRYRIDVPVTRRKKTDGEDHGNDGTDEEEPIAILSIGEGEGKECAFAAGRKEMGYLLGGVEQIEQVIRKLSGENESQ